MFFAPFFFIEIFTPSHVKIKFTRCCCCCIVLHICIPAYKPYILFFFLIPFNKNFYHQPTQPTTTILVVSKFHSFLQKERRLASQKNFPINHRQRREITTTLILILYTRRQLIDYTPTKDTITLGATPIDITVSFCIKQLLLPPLPIITFFFLDKTN